MRLLRRFFESLALRILLFAVSGVASAYLSLAGLKVIEKPIHWLEIAAIVAVAVISFATSAQATLLSARRKRLQTRRALVSKLLGAAYLTIVTDHKLPIEASTITLFLVVGRRKRSHLRRFARVGFQEMPSSDVRWTMNKGIIGECWATGVVARRNLAALHASHGDCDSGAWESLTAKERMHLSFDEWVRTRTKFGAIVAVPYQRRGKIAGCISFTGPSKIPSWDADRRVEEALNAAARTIEASERT